VRAQAPLDEGIDPIDVFWPVYEGVFAVTPSSVVGRITWPTPALGSMADVTIEIEHDEDWESDRSDHQRRSSSAAEFGDESGGSESAQGARHLPVASPSRCSRVAMLLFLARRGGVQRYCPSRP
jgi:hypothetical protein